MMSHSGSNSAGERPIATLEYFYCLALRLYPARFRAAYATAMGQAFRDALRDSSLVRRDFIPLVLRDLITSLIKEYFAMMRDSLLRPALVFNALVLAGIATVLALALYGIPQNVLRSGLNDPQVQIAGDLASQLEQGETTTDAVPHGSIDMARSLSPFVIVYDDQGRPIVSQAQLNGTTPIPPHGVFDSVRQNGESRITWQPLRTSDRTVRIAAVVRRVNGSNPGFVLAGRNMREVEARIGHVQTMAGLTWLGMLGLILTGAIAFGWYTQNKPVEARQP
jgi:hypothetical protein